MVVRCYAWFAAFYRFLCSSAFDSFSDIPGGNGERGVSGKARKDMSWNFLLLLMCLFSCNGGSDQDDLKVHPEVIYRCLATQVAKDVELSDETNPYYLRGDLDDDGKADYAVAVSGKKTHRLGVLICRGNGVNSILGAVNPASAPFSDMPRDLFFAPNWLMFSKSEISDLQKSEHGVPRPLPPIRGEMIAMVWEDGICLIYWDGTKFKWAGVRSRQ
jgi:hypothetical protein